MPAIRLLIIEDNEALVASIYEYFEMAGVILDTAPNGIAGIHLALANDYDAIVLDIMLPGINGLEVCRRLRDEGGIESPIIMLTAKDTLSDKLEGFASGADDYLIKPFALPELEARVRALVRRGHVLAGHNRTLRVHDLQYNPSIYEITRQGRVIELNPSCRRILEILMRESPRIVTRERLEVELWGDDPPDHDVLRKHIYSLRTAIDRPFDTSLLKTVSRVGYRISVDPDDIQANTA